MTQTMPCLLPVRQRARRQRRRNAFGKIFVGDAVVVVTQKLLPRSAVDGARDFLDQGLASRRNAVSHAFAPEIVGAIILVIQQEAL